MAKKFNKFRVHGAYKKKSAAHAKKRSTACYGECFILTRMIRGAKRFVVLQKKG